VSRRGRVLDKATAGALVVSLLALAGPPAAAQSSGTTDDTSPPERSDNSSSIPVLDPALDLVDVLAPPSPSSSNPVPLPPALGVTGSVAGSVRPAQDVPVIRSVTVVQSAPSYGSCTDQRGQVTDGLSFPNGVCRLTVTVTNGAAAGHIQVRGGVATTNDPGAIWVLCGGSGGPDCTGYGGSPGRDEYQQWTSGPGGTGPRLSPRPQCDKAFSAQCRAGPAQASTETLFLRGPESSSKAGATYSTNLVWTAVP
jgi:hypothetical protein